MIATQTTSSARVQFIQDLNEKEYSEEELAFALEQTLEHVGRVKNLQEKFMREVASEHVAAGIQIDQVSEAWRKVAQDGYCCGVCFQVLRDPVCCANESCNYMLCREHLSPDMPCPNRCGSTF